jgi:ATP-dependent DNA ligase
VFDGGFID